MAAPVTTGSYVAAPATTAPATTAIVCGTDGDDDGCAGHYLNDRTHDDHVVCSADGDDCFADDDGVLRRCTSNDLNGHASDSQVVCSTDVTSDNDAHAIAKHVIC